MREAKLRIVTYERRMNKDGSNPIEAGMMRTNCAILYNKFDFQFKRDVDREPPTALRGADGEILTDTYGQPKTVAFRVDLDKMKKIVERQRQMESANKASRMDLSWLEHHGHAANVAWNESGAREEWPWQEQHEDEWLGEWPENKGGTTARRHTAVPAGRGRVSVCLQKQMQGQERQGQRQRQGPRRRKRRQRQEHTPAGLDHEVGRRHSSELQLLLVWQHRQILPQA